MFCVGYVDHPVHHLHRPVSPEGFWIWSIVVMPYLFDIGIAYTSRH